MSTHPTIRSSRIFLATAILASALALSACFGAGTKLQPPTASIQQLSVQSDGTWAIVVRFQNYSYDTGMHVYAIDAALSLNGKPAGHIVMSPALDIPAMDADVATVTFNPGASGIAALTGAKRNAVQYELKGTLSVGKDSKGAARPFPLDVKDYISPVPGVTNIWR